MLRGFYSTFLPVQVSECSLKFLTMFHIFFGLWLSNSLDQSQFELTS